MDAKELPLVSKEVAAEGTMAFRFRKQDLRFQAGQAADFTLTADGKRETHTFTISSSPDNPDTIMVTTRLRDSPFKNALRRMEPGQTVHVTTPNGDFLLPRDPATPVVFLAGGIGITPFRSMLRHMAAVGDRRRCVLFYSNPTRAETTFLEELEALANELDLKLVVTVTKEEPDGWQTGRIDEAMLRSNLDDDVVRRAVFYIAGPPKMIAALRAEVGKLGVPDDRIKSDEFTGY